MPRPLFFVPGGRASRTSAAACADAGARIRALIKSGQQRGPPGRQGHRLRERVEAPAAMPIRRWVHLAVTLQAGALGAAAVAALAK
jgi:hypothetical protein